MANKADALPVSLPPRGLDRVRSAEYVGVSPSKFDGLVADRRMPQPKEIDRRLVWDRHELDAAFGALPKRNRRDDAATEDRRDEVSAPMGAIKVGRRGPPDG